MPDKVRVICREWRLDRLLMELALHHLDMVLTDTPAPVNIAGEFEDASPAGRLRWRRGGGVPGGQRVGRPPSGPGAVALGEAEQVRIEYFALSALRRVTHPCVLAVKNAAELGLA